MTSKIYEKLLEGLEDALNSFDLKDKSEEEKAKIIATLGIKFGQHFSVPHEIFNAVIKLVKKIDPEVKESNVIGYFTNILITETACNILFNDDEEFKADNDDIDAVIGALVKASLNLAHETNRELHVKQFSTTNVSETLQ